MIVATYNWNECENYTSKTINNDWNKVAILLIQKVHVQMKEYKIISS